jgi:hypothetical protein
MLLGLAGPSKSVNSATHQSKNAKLKSSPTSEKSGKPKGEAVAALAVFDLLRLADARVMS